MLDELPRNALSKVDRNVLQTMAVRADKAGRSRIGAASLSEQRPARRSGTSAG
jgi:hypothetical protein